VFLDEFEALLGREALDNLVDSARLLEELGDAR
jgi:hypothetical protein